MTTTLSMTTGECPVQGGQMYRVQVGMDRDVHLLMTLLVWDVQPALHASLGSTSDRWQVVGMLAPDGEVVSKWASWVPLRGYYNAGDDSIRQTHHDGELPARCALRHDVVSVIGDLGPYKDPSSGVATREIMLESTLRSLAAAGDVRMWDRDREAASLRPLVDQVRELRAQLAEAEAARDRAIRVLYHEHQVPAITIARVARLDRRRIYQICDTGDGA